MAVNGLVLLITVQRMKIIIIVGNTIVGYHVCVCNNHKHLFDCSLQLCITVLQLQGTVLLEVFVVVRLVACVECIVVLIYLNELFISTDTTSEMEKCICITQHYYQTICPTLLACYTLFLVFS